MTGVRSLRFKIGVPLLALMVATVGAVTWVTQRSLQRELEDRLQQRASDLASTVAFALESSRSLSSMQRLVSAMGAERDVEMIVVALGHPARVRASTRGEWLNSLVDDLPVAHVGEDLFVGSRSRGAQWSHWDGGRVFDYTLPLHALVPEVDSRRAIPGAVMVHLDATRTLAAVQENAIIGVWALLALIVVVAATMWALANRVLFRPLARLQALTSDDAGSDEVWAALEGPDEIGRLAGSLREARRRRREALHALEVQQRALDEHCIVAITDPRGRITHANDRFCERSGYARDELLGRTHALLNSGTHPRGFFKDMWNHITAGQSWHGEVCNRTRNGDLYWVDSTIVPMRDVHGAIEGYVAIRTDITPLKEQERAIAAARDEAQEASRAKSEFLAVMSHEIRTPMNGVVGCAQLLTNTTLTTQQREWVDTIVTSGDALLTIIDDILDFSKVEAGRMEIEWRPCDLRGVLSRAALVMRPRTEAAGLTLILDVDPQLPAWIEMDEVRLRQVILNLLGNAVKFTRRGGISVRARAERGADGPTMLIEVADTGIGIAPDVLPRLFERFQQADASTTRRFGGTGLGLAIVKRLTELMQGTVGARSQQGRGSTFWIRLPLRESAPAELSMPANTAEDLDLSGLTVLVADDNDVNRLVAGAMLEHLGIDVHFAENGVEAVSHVALKRPDLVLMDCHMPEMDGFDATMAIRAQERALAQAPISIVALTASVAGEEQERCRQSGMDGFLAKPLQEVQLVQVLRRARDRALAGDAR